MLMENINNAFLRKEQLAIIRYLKFQLPRRSHPEINDPLFHRNFPRLVVSARSEFHKGSGMYAGVAVPSPSVKGEYFWRRRRSREGGRRFSTTVG